MTIYNYTSKFIIEEDKKSSTHLFMKSHDIQKKK